MHGNELYMWGVLQERVQYTLAEDLWHGRHQQFFQWFSQFNLLRYRAAYERRDERKRKRRELGERVLHALKLR